MGYTGDILSTYWVEKTMGVFCSTKLFFNHNEWFLGQFTPLGYFLPKSITVNHVFVFIVGARYRFGKTYGNTTREIPACADPQGYAAGKYITFPVI